MVDQQCSAAGTSDFMEGSETGRAGADHGNVGM